MASFRSLPVGVVLLEACLVVATVAGLVVMWPDGSNELKLDSSQRPPTYTAEIVGTEPVRCRGPKPTRTCARIKAKLLNGPDEGRVVGFPSGESTADPLFSDGDRVRLAKFDVPEGAPRGDPYSFSDFDRRGPMLWLLFGFAAVVILFGRLRGVLSLVGLGLSVAVIGAFIVPAILEGTSPLAVALVGSMAVMFATMGFAHGIGPKSVAASLGTAMALLLTAGLAILATELANITGFSSEEATLLQGVAGELSLEGLVLAGIVIAALGVLDDLTISQSSAVIALKRANPVHGARELYRGATAIGRDHVAATVNTLVLAYVGASLPLLLVFTVGDIPFADAINREAVAQQVIGILVGSVGLITAVPLTTGIAAFLASRSGPATARGSHAQPQ